MLVEMYVDLYFLCFGGIVHYSSRILCYQNLAKCQSLLCFFDKYSSYVLPRGNRNKLHENCIICNYFDLHAAATRMGGLPSRLMVIACNNHDHKFRL